MILTDRVVKINRGIATIDEPVILYRGDKNIEIQFQITNPRLRFSKQGNVLEFTEASYAQLAILNPNGSNAFTEITETKDGIVIFKITGEMIDQLDEVGFYNFHIRLFDETQESRITLPLIEDGIEIREPYVAEDVDPQDVNTVGGATVGYAIVVEDRTSIGNVFDSNGSYNKTTWTTGDRITEGRLNKIEDALDVISDRGAGADVDLTGYATKDDLKDKADKGHTHNEYITEHQDISHLAHRSELPISVLQGKSLLCIGDSISTNQNASKIYSQIFAQMGIFSSVTTEGVAGREVSAKSSKGTQYRPLANVYMNMPQADIITIFMGVNDYGHHTPLGTMEDRTDVSFYGALHLVITGLISMYPASRIIWITPMHRDYGTLGRDDTPNEKGHILKDYVNAIREVCEMYAVPVIDLFKINGMSPLIPIIKQTYTTDGLHLNNLGHQKIAGVIKQWLEIYCADLTVEVPAIQTYTITYKYMCNGASIKANTTEVVTKGTSKTFSTSNAPSISGYTISSVSPTSATINSNTTVTYTYTADPVEPEIPGHTHNYTAVITKQATCTTQGIRTYTCSECGDEYTENISTIPHNYVESITKQATCTEEGIKTFTCGECGHNYTESITKLEHNYVDEVCTLCGKTNAKFKPEEGKTYVTLQPGNAYGTSATINDKLSLNPKFISVPSGFTVTPKEGYEIGVYWSGALKSGGWISTTYTASQGVSGTFGIAIRKVDKSDFDLTVDSIYPHDYLEVSDPSVFEIS